MLDNLRRVSSPLPPEQLVRTRGAFTLVEVMVAACVLAIGMAGTFWAARASLSSINHARHLSFASQVLQDELERLRLRSWDQLQAIQDSGDTTVSVANKPAAFSTLAFTRHVTDLRDGLKEITVEATWGGAGERVRSARLVTRYARHGLNDYVYTAR